MAHYRQPRTPATGAVQTQQMGQALAPLQALHAQQQQMHAAQLGQKLLHLSSHKRQMQQFYLHKLFDLLSDAEFLPSIPSDPIATAIQVQESMASFNSPYMPSMSPGHRPDQPYYGSLAKSRRYSGQFLHQHLFGGKRNDYAQYKLGA